MCLILSYNPEARVANTDIICYKLVVKKANGIYNSLYRRFEYIIRRNYKIPEIEKCTLKENRFGVKILEEGVFHSFAREMDAFIDYREQANILISSYHFPMILSVVKCAIPKGAIYYMGSTNSMLSYASSQIKILEEICFQ